MQSVSPYSRIQATTNLLSINTGYLLQFEHFIRVKSYNTLSFLSGSFRLVYASSTHIVECISTQFLHCRAGYRCIPPSVHPFTCRQTHGLFSVWGYHGQSCFKYLCGGLFSWALFSLVTGKHAEVGVLARWQVTLNIMKRCCRAWQNGRTRVSQPRRQRMKLPWLHPLARTGCQSSQCEPLCWVCSGTTHGLALEAAFPC